MKGRPEILFPLFGDLTKLEGVGPKTAQSFISLGVEKPRDLIFTLPASGIDRSKRETVQGAEQGEVVTVEVTVENHQPPRQRGHPYRVVVSDSQLSFQLVFFHAHADYLSKILPTGQKRVISGKVEYFDGVAQIAHPDHVVTTECADEIPLFEPVYPLTAGVTQKIMQKATGSALKLAPELTEWIDPAFKEQEGWPD